MGKRLSVLALNYGWYGESAAEDFQDLLSRSLEMQSRCMALDWQRMRSLNAQISALCNLALVEAVLGATPEKIDALMAMIMPKLETVILDDGGHASRMPDRHVEMLRQLVELRMDAPPVLGLRQADDRNPRRAVREPKGDQEDVEDKTTHCR